MEAMAEECDHLDQESFDSCVESTPNRTEACIIADGGHTKW